MANWNWSPSLKSSVIVYTFSLSLSSFVIFCASPMTAPKFDSRSTGDVPLPTIANSLVSSTYVTNPANTEVSSVTACEKSNLWLICGVANQPTKMLPSFSGVYSLEHAPFSTSSVCSTVLPSES